ncbi:hypothetical protein UPYG_G00309410 [Umbra pygmaea]|uniref:GB1/RHD3-type G domain-containing protein n=1 Tax=Umbra pygmaea TaxID=75934 RepID=A0ABD0W0Z4_UMBPY
MAGQTVSMKEPVCLIENDSDGKLHVVRSALDILDQIDQHVVVVAVVGLYRTGKSYLMNKLAGKSKGFALGATIQSKTKGIWMWCVPHPVKRDHTLVLLDTEGLGDVEKGDEKNDNWIFSLAVLLSSTLVYNSMGTIDNNALEKLHYVTELTKHMKVKSNQQDEEASTEDLRYFPSLVWTVRDFTLSLDLNGKPITANEYLENALEMEKGSSKACLPHSCLRKYFSSRWCFVFERPANAEKMKRMDELTDDDLEPLFVQQAKTFCDHIFTEAKTKSLKHGLRVTGRLLGNLAETYVTDLRGGQIPCLDNAVVALAKIENPRAIERARAHYQKEMANRVAYPTETQEELSEVHGLVEKEAVAIFINSSFKDEDQKYQLKLMKVLQEEYEKICERNYKESQKACCKSKIQCIFAPLEEKIKDGSYMSPGGYKEYCNDLKLATSEYRSEGGRGVKAEEVLMKYLETKTSIGQAILSADKSLTDAKQRAEDQDRLIAEMQSTHEENMKQLIEMLEKKNRQAMADHEQFMQARMKEIFDIQKQEFAKKEQQLQREIDALKVTK